MKSVIDTGRQKFITDGASIRVVPSITSSKDQAIARAGVVSILPKVQIALGESYETFLNALELSRLPIALKKTITNGKYETHDIIRLSTGNIQEARISTLSVYDGIMVGLTYSMSVLNNKEFRRLVKLSAMQQIRLCDKDDKLRLYKASECISRLTKVDRDKLIIAETAKSIRVKVPFKSKLNLPICYIFNLDKTNAYKLMQIAFDYNDAAKAIQALNNKE